MNNLRRGDTGRDVFNLQKNLSILGFLDHKPTGNFASLTEKAVSESQQFLGIKQGSDVNEEYLELIKCWAQKRSLWALDELLHLSEGSWMCLADSTAPVVNICDGQLSAIKPGALVYSLDSDFYKSEKNIVKAFNLGASVVVAPRWIKCSVRDTWNILQVDSIRDFTYGIASAARHRFGGKVAAVTGSAGKTSTVNILGQFLSHQGESYYNDKNQNLLNHLAKSLMALPPKKKFSVFEVAAMPALMVKTSKIIKPDVVVFTGTGNSHLSYMHSRVIVADVKSQLFYGMGEGSTAVINRDDKFFNRIFEAAQEFGAGKIITFGENEEASFRLLNYGIHEAGTWADIEIYQARYRIDIAMQGKHWVMNVLASMAAAYAFGMGKDELVELASEVTGVYRRGDKHSLELNGKKISLYNDSFNANPLSMQTAVDTLSSIPKKNSGNRRVMVLGEMGALGDFAEREHQSLAEYVNNSDIDKVFLFGDLMEHTHSHLVSEKRGGTTADYDSLLELLKGELLDGDIVVVKGSRSNRLERIVKDLKG